MTEEEERSIKEIEKDLTDKQKIFCREYVIDWNATRAAIAAGYSNKTAQEIGSQNLSKLIIQEYIDYIQKDLIKLCGVSTLSNVKYLKKILESKEKTSDQLKAIEIINKMLGFNAPEKQDFTTDGKSIDLIQWVK